MTLKEIVKESLQIKRLEEGFTTEGEPDLKYYAFDWDDNVVTMPTKIFVISDEDEEIGLSTEEFSKYRTKIGKEPFNLKGDTIINYAKNPFRGFRSAGDNMFLIDSMTATPGPAWGDFVECINGGSIFSIITARGNSPKIIKESIHNYIKSNRNGINKKTLFENLCKYRDLACEREMDEDESINEYLGLCRFYPVMYNVEDESAINPEKRKVEFLREFIEYVKKMSSKLGKKAYLKNDIKNNFIPKIGFSDDDPKNVEKIKQFLNKEYPGEVNTYLTKGGIKKEV